MQVSVTAVRGFCASLLFIVGSVLLLIISLFLEWVQIDGRAAWAYPEAGVFTATGLTTPFRQTFCAQEIPRGSVICREQSAWQPYSPFNSSFKWTDTYHEVVLNAATRTAALLIVALLCGVVLCVCSIFAFCQLSKLHHEDEPLSADANGPVVRDRDESAGPHASLINVLEPSAAATASVAPARGSTERRQSVDDSLLRVGLHNESSMRAPLAPRRNSAGSTDGATGRSRSRKRDRLRNVVGSPYTLAFLFAAYSGLLIAAWAAFIPGIKAVWADGKLITMQAGYVWRPDLPPVYREGLYIAAIATFSAVAAALFQLYCGVIILRLNRGVSALSVVDFHGGDGESINQSDAYARLV